ncbi:unnamed protein product [Phyllotreta striolata]|uniref:Uncharacterized protein n=1 Tax=Phyllotreta striolata TaxID=444603 RepID=A0A9N9TZY7_PHYSR|nr:unnamed protein product [Phyllotreta striolata]
MSPAGALIVFIALFPLLTAVDGAQNNQTEADNESLMDKGRTFVRNSLKRFAVLLPVVFFKLGIAFAMLLLVTVVSVNNGFIGFLLLVVGLSSVLARLQEARKQPPVAPYLNPLPIYQNRYVQDWDRKDNDDRITQAYSRLYGYPQPGGYYKQNSLVS